jgi:hypothetical protein
MDTLSKNDGCHYNYHHSSRLNGDESKYSHESSPLEYRAVCSFWERGKFVTQSRDLLHTALGKYHETIPRYWENHPRSERASTSTSTNKKKQDDLRVQLLKTNMRKLFQSQQAASCADKSKHVQPEPNIAADSTVAFSAENNSVTSEAKCQTRQKIFEGDYSFEEDRYYNYYIHNRKEQRVIVNSNICIPGGSVGAKQYKNRCGAENNSVTSEAGFVTRQKIFKGNYSFEEDRYYNYYIHDRKEQNVTLNSNICIRGGSVSAKVFKNRCGAENNIVTSEARCQTRQKIFKGDYSFEEDRYYNYYIRNGKEQSVTVNSNIL